jgi:hypothetical protein
MDLFPYFLHEYSSCGISAIFELSVHVFGLLMVLRKEDESGIKQDTELFTRM